MVIVQIDSGKIRGRINQFQGKQFYSFQNVPYAKPPLEKLRFKAPQSVEAWEGVRDATEEGNECVSRHLITRKFVGSEDCLNLNVYTPELPGNSSPRALKPVMFWIHGGIFMTGSNKTELFGPEFLVSEDVVLVTINYRLGVLGFLSLDDPSLGVPGNAGLKDMVMALRWVQKNITKFSGDPNNVTVFGESAGAAAAHLLMLSPMTKGLLHKVIAQSACALNIWIYGRRSARTVAERLGFSHSDDKKLLSFLENVPALDVLKAQMQIDAEDFIENDIRFFGVVVERTSNEEAFLTKHPMELILTGDYNHVPFIMGYNNNEGMAFNEIAPGASKKRFFENLELSVPLALKLQRNSSISRQIAEEIKRFYFGDGQYSKEEHLLRFFQLTTDTSFLKDVYFTVKHHIKTSKQPIYFYKITLETELNVMKKLTGMKVPGVYHGDDIGYLFKTMFTPEINPGSIEDLAQKRVTKLWTNFAKYGNPTPDDQNDDLFKIKWKEVDRDNLNYLEIGNELSMKKNPEPVRMAFWEKIYQVNPAICKL